MWWLIKKYQLLWHWPLTGWGWRWPARLFNSPATNPQPLTLAGDLIPPNHIWLGEIVWSVGYCQLLQSNGRIPPLNKFVFYSQHANQITCQELARQWPKEYPDLYIPWLQVSLRHNSFGMAEFTGLPYMRSIKYQGKVIPEGNLLCQW